MDTELNLDGKVFIVEHNEGADSDLPPGSTFLFKQVDGEVQASYSGGRIKRGSLTGQIVGDELHHRYTQTLNDGRRQSGRATVKIQRRTDGRLELIDEWAWQSQSEEARCLMVERKNNE